MTFDLAPSPTTVHGAVSSSLEPVLVVESGARITAQTVDVGFGIESPVDAVQPRRKVMPARMEIAGGPGCVGPIGVRGAEPGLVLAVTLHRLEPGPWGFTYLGGGFPTWLADDPAIADIPAGVVRWTIDVDAGTATSDLGWIVPLRPFLGTIGVAPASSELVAGWTPRPTGATWIAASWSLAARSIFQSRQAEPCSRSATHTPHRVMARSAAWQLSAR